MSERQEARPLDAIAPDGLVEQVDGAETVDDAIDYLHQFGESTTPREERPRCPVIGCGTVRIGPRTGYDGQHEHPESEYVCQHGHRFDTPAPPLAEVDKADVEEGSFQWVTDADLEEPPVGRRLEQLDDRSLTALAIVLYSPWNHTDADPSYRDLGTVFPYSRDWVGERVRAWRDGEFRDLVADPRPWGGR